VLVTELIAISYDLAISDSPFSSTQQTRVKITVYERTPSVSLVRGWVNYKCANNWFLCPFCSRN